MINNDLMEIKSSILSERMSICFTDELKIPNLDSRSKVEKYGHRQIRDLSSRIEKYKTVKEKNAIDIKRYKDRNVWRFDVNAIMSYINTDLANIQEEEDAVVEKAIEKRINYKAVHNEPSKGPTYLVIERGGTRANPLFGHWDLNEINKFMDMPYIDKRTDEQGNRFEVLVNTLRPDRKEFPLEPEYQGPDGWRKLELFKYPWYKVNRIEAL